MSDRLLLPESLAMLHPDWLGGMCITCWWAWSVRCILLRSAGSCADRQEVVEVEMAVVEWRKEEKTERI